MFHSLKQKKNNNKRLLFQTVDKLKVSSLFLCQKWYNIYKESRYIMLKKQSMQQELIMMTLEDLVPQDNIYRLINKYVDFDFVYDVVAPLYSNTGRGSIDPVNIFKIELINIFECNNSFGKTCRDVELNVDIGHF